MPGLLIGPASAGAQQFEKPGLYRVDAVGWIQSKIPGGGEVFACSRCEFPVQIRFTYSVPSDPTMPFQSNEEFLQTLATGSAQRRFARSIIEDQVPENTPIDITKTSVSELGGLMMFRFHAVTKLGLTLSRKTMWIAIHRNRILMVALSYFEDGLDKPSRNQIRAFFTSIEFL